MGLNPGGKTKASRAAMSSELEGAIAIVTGGCAIHAWPGWGPYSAAKAGLNQFSPSFNRSSRCNAVWINSDETTHHTGETDAGRND